MRGLAQLEPATTQGPARPSSSAEQASDAAGAPRTPAKGSGRTPTSVWGARQKILMIGALITLVGLGLTGYREIMRPRLMDFERMAPLTAWRDWQDMRHGIDQRARWEAFFHERLAIYRRWMIVALFVVAVGLLVMGSSLLAPSRRRRRRGRRPATRAAPSRLRRAT